MNVEAMVEQQAGQAVSKSIGAYQHLLDRLTDEQGNYIFASEITDKFSLETVITHIRTEIREWIKNELRDNLDQASVLGAVAAAQHFFDAVIVPIDLPINDRLESLIERAVRAAIKPAVLFLAERIKDRLE